MVKWLVTLGLCLALGGALALFKVNQINQAIAFAESFPEPVDTVQMAEAKPVMWTRRVSVVAEVVAVQSVDFSNELAGRIVEVNFEPGARVEAGQILVRLDTSEERAQLAGARAEAELARLALERNEKLIQTGAASTEARDMARAQFNAATAVVQQLEAIIRKMTLRAPFTARAGLHELEPGQYLDAGTMITRLVGINEEIWIDFRLPQQQAEAEVGDVVAVTDATRAMSDFNATIIARDAFVERNSRSVRYRAAAANLPGSTYPGSMLTVEVKLGDPIRAVELPDTAIRRDAFGASVFILEPSESDDGGTFRARRREVTLGRVEARRVVVTGGLEVGEQVAATGSFKLRDGALAKVASGDNAVDRSEG